MRHNFDIRWIKFTICRLGLFLILLFCWHSATQTEWLPSFFFGQPIEISLQIYHWFQSGKIFPHLYVTLVETIASFIGGSAIGLIFGLWLSLSPLALILFEPYLKALNAMPRIVLAPIFAMWFGLGMTSKIALGMTLVFFSVFFNVFQGVREVSPIILANAQMLGANRRQLMQYIYLPSALSWFFSSLHTAVGMAFVGAVIGEYLGSSRGIGYLILQAEGTFDINIVIAGIIVVIVFALLLDGFVTIIERRLLKWQPITHQR